MTSQASEIAADVVLRVDGALGRITLNRPKALNALSATMVDAMAQALDEWARDDRIHAVLTDGAGDRGLCAGGDIRALHREVSTGTSRASVAFMKHEYRLNAQIGSYPKPYVAFMDGIVMGGGVGVSGHGGIRLVTERSMIAMPEVAIGLFPDVGGTFLLGRAPGELGTHAALTARRFNAADAILLGVADYTVPAQALPAIVAALAACKAVVEVEPALRAFQVDPPDGVLAGQRAWIDPCYRHDSVEAIVASLQASDHVEARAAAADIMRHSPTALKVTLRALREARASSSLAVCLEREFQMIQTVLDGHEILEGIRAAVIDKDGKPRWRPSRLDDVDASLVDAYFRIKSAGLGLVG